MHIAMSLLVDLNLSRSPFARRHFVTATESTDGFELRTEYHAENLAEHSLEERRAFLGCIFLSSVYWRPCLGLLMYESLTSKQPIEHVRQPESCQIQ